jgi:hypothetical protein
MVFGFIVLQERFSRDLRMSMEDSLNVSSTSTGGSGSTSSSVSGEASPSMDYYDGV